MFLPNCSPVCFWTHIFFIVSDYIAHYPSNTRFVFQIKIWDGNGPHSWLICCMICYNSMIHGLLARYVKLRVAHVPGMPGTLFPPPRVSDPDMHHGTCVTHVPWCMPGSLTTSFLWSGWRVKRSPHFRCMRNPQFYISGKRPFERSNE